MKLVTLGLLLIFFAYALSQSVNYFYFVNSPSSSGFCLNVKPLFLFINQNIFDLLTHFHKNIN